MTRRWLSGVAVGALSFGLGCPQVLGIKDGKPRGAGAGGASGGSGGSGGSASGAAGGAGGTGGSACGDPMGQTPWVLSFGDAAGIQQAYDVTPLANGGFVVTGSYFSGMDPLSLPAAAGIDAFLLRLDADGGVAEATSFNGAGTEVATAIASHSDDSVTVAGTFTQQLVLASTTLTTSNTPNGFLTRYASATSEVWAHPIDISDSSSSSPPVRDVAVAGNAVLTVGQFRSGIVYGMDDLISSTSAGFLLRTDDNGDNGVFMGFYSVTGTDAGLNSVAAGGDGAVVAGFFDTDVTNAFTCSITGSGGHDGLVAWVAPSGLLACRAIGGTGTDVAVSAAVDSQGNTYVVGKYGDGFTIDGVGCPTVDNFNVFLLKFDETRTAVEVVCGTGDATPDDLSVAVDQVDNVVVAGSFTTGTMNLGGGTLMNGDATTDGFVMLFDSAGEHVVSRQIFGATGAVSVQAVSADACGSAVVVGRAGGTSLTVDGHDPVALAGSGDAFVARFTP